MRLVVLIALLGLAAASCPYNSKRCFARMMQGFGNEQEVEYDQEDEIDSEDDVPECMGGRCSMDEDEEPCRGPQCYRPQGQACQPQYQLIKQLEQPNCQLAAKLYKQAKQERDDKNVVVSPVAVQLTLAALQKGARGNTKAQMKRTQCPGLTQQQCQQAHAAMIRTLKGTNNVQQTQKPGQPTNSQQKAKINCAMGIIIDQETCAQPQFVETVQKCLGGQVKKCSFKTSPQQCRQLINQLVSAKTCQKVKNMLPQDALTDNTQMIAIGALQLQAKWGRQFRQRQITKIAPFYPLGSQKPKQCQVIQSQGQFNYYEDEQVQVVGIPTEQAELVVYAIVPKNKDGLTLVEKELIQNGQQLKQILDECDQQKQYTLVQLPKIQVNSKLDAKKTLLKQGIQDAFDCDQADFDGICNMKRGQQNLHLNKLIHQATIKITEEGICSANTGVQQAMQDQMEYQGYDDQESQYDQGAQAQVKANHAFAFAVKHKPSNQIVMVGRVVDGCQKPQGQQINEIDDE